MSETADAAHSTSPAEETLRLRGSLLRAGGSSYFHAGVAVSLAAHVGTVVAAVVSWRTGMWELMFPPPGVQSVASPAQRMIEVTSVPRPTLEDELPPAMELTADAQATEPPAPAEPLTPRQVEITPVGTLPAHEAPTPESDPVTPRELAALETPIERRATENLPAPAATETTAHPRADRNPEAALAEARVALDDDMRQVASQPSTASSGTASKLPPQPTYSPSPVYPPELLAARIGGRVKLEVELDDEGRVSSARVHTSSGYAAFDKAALDVIYRWRFAWRGGRMPRERRIVVPIRFGIVP